jgi:hypothetical protein
LLEPVLYKGGRLLLKAFLSLIPPHIYAQIFGDATSLSLGKPPRRVEAYIDLNADAFKRYPTIKLTPIE